ncbi:putative transmembrane protein [Cinnamomum micranthum f. kanehirae]|uniref:Putative transmembrane protein n=1 Tax=Cinnamomum micranthum f. kanehirae TaxID=337451 RepID=A0A3S3NPJ1_9MAGN|nr:putative transmembrane protein [Cinnamomum micranthum f. kanehirae]
MKIAIFKELNKNPFPPLGQPASQPAKTVWSKKSKSSKYHFLSILIKNQQIHPPFSAPIPPIKTISTSHIKLPMGKHWFKKMKKDSWPWPWRFTPSSLRFKRIEFQLSILDDILFKLLSIFEAILLVSALCFFYLCCGCNF